MQNVMFSPSFGNQPSRRVGCGTLANRLLGALVIALVLAGCSMSIPLVSAHAETGDASSLQAAESSAPLNTQSKSTAQKNKAARKALLNYAQTSKSIIRMPGKSKYAFKDLTGDGIVEMVYYDAFTPDQTRVLRYKSGKVKTVASGWSGNKGPAFLTYFSKTKALKSYYDQSGMKDFYYLKWKGGKYKSVARSSKDKYAGTTYYYVGKKQVPKHTFDSYVKKNITKGKKGYSLSKLKWNKL